ncbi:MAG TPA: hypothetical protein EYQ02_05015 [Microbacterium sp.]|nr:hypothetical protein [Microbacterium sp.]
MWDDPVEVDEHAPPLAEGQEWVVPHGRPNERMVVQVIPDDAPPLIREGLARRRVQAIEGECPCGGPLVWRDEHPDATFWRDAAPAEGRGLLTDRVCAVHFRDCPAGDAVFVPAMVAWSEDGRR